MDTGPSFNAVLMFTKILRVKKLAFSFKCFVQGFLFRSLEESQPNRQTASLKSCLRSDYIQQAETSTDTGR